MDKINIYVNRYAYRVNWSEEDQCYIGNSLEMPLVMAHGDTPEEVMKELRFATEFAVECLLEDGETPPVPFALQTFKGRISLRVPEIKHRELVMTAQEQGVSLNQYILSRL